MFLICCFEFEIKREEVNKYKPKQDNQFYTRQACLTPFFKFFKLSVQHARNMLN